MRVLNSVICTTVDDDFGLGLYDRLDSYGPGLYSQLDGRPVRYYQADGRGHMVEVEAAGDAFQRTEEEPVRPPVPLINAPPAPRFRIIGSAAPFNRLSEPYHDDSPGSEYPAYRSKFVPGCFNALGNVVLQDRHDGGALACTSNGTLRLWDGPGALMFHADVVADVEWKLALLAPLVGCAMGASVSWRDEEFRFEPFGFGTVKVIAKAGLVHVALMFSHLTAFKTSVSIQRG